MQTQLNSTQLVGTCKQTPPALCSEPYLAALGRKNGPRNSGSVARWPPVGISVAPASGGNRASAFNSTRLDIALSVPHQQFVAYTQQQQQRGVFTADLGGTLLRRPVGPDRLPKRKSKVSQSHATGPHRSRYRRYRTVGGRILPNALATLDYNRLRSEGRES